MTSFCDICCWTSSNLQPIKQMINKITNQFVIVLRNNICCLIYRLIDTVWYIQVCFSIIWCRVQLQMCNTKIWTRSLILYWHLSCILWYLNAFDHILFYSMVPWNRSSVCICILFSNHYIIVKYPLYILRTFYCADLRNNSWKPYVYIVFTTGRPTSMNYFDSNM